MALKQIDVSTLPVTRMSAGKPSVTLNDHGQAAFSAAAAEVFDGIDLAQPLWDEEKRILAWQGVDKPVKGKSYLKIAKAKKSKGCSVSCAGLLQQLGYDYRTAGSQKYVADVDEKRKLVMIELPAETPNPRPKVTRARKSQNGNKSASEVPEGATEPSEEDEDIEI